MTTEARMVKQTEISISKKDYLKFESLLTGTSFKPGEYSVEKTANEGKLLIDRQSKDKLYSITVLPFPGDSKYVKLLVPTPSANKSNTANKVFQDVQTALSKCGIKTYDVEHIFEVQTKSAVQKH